jgi:coenzyme F420-reducing hydrogenase delta subunit
MAHAAGAPGGGSPRILVLSTNNVSDPGVDLAGSAHMDYPVSVRVIALPCSSGINPRWIVHALDRGFDGVFIAADGGDCSKIPNCTERTGLIVSRAQELMRARGYNAARVRMAALCSVCSEPFVSHMSKFGKELAGLAEAKPPAGG